MTKDEALNIIAVFVDEPALTPARVEWWVSFVIGVAEDSPEKRTIRINAALNHMRANPEKWERNLAANAALLARLKG